MNFNIFKKKPIIIFWISLAFFTSGCVTKNLSQKGHIFDENDLSNIKVGLTNKENTIKYLGHPLNKSYFNDNTWIYYSYKMKEVLFFKPRLEEQKILLIEFDSETDLIKNLSLYDVDSNKYEILDNASDVDEDRDSIINDILKNVGQFSM